MMKKLSAAVLSLGILTGCAAETAVEEPPAEKAEPVVAEEPAAVPEKEQKKEKPEEETFGLNKKETEAMKTVLSSGPYDYSLKDVAAIEKRGEDDTFVRYKVELKSGETLLPSINKVLLGGE